ncbi:hypothetical protein PAV_13c01510 [Paenibacillus alvei DSM 29]|nr:hypothetical protein PAV_13c01510 [Paenibacillus alvei DSM 29]
MRNEYRNKIAPMDASEKSDRGAKSKRNAIIQLLVIIANFAATRQRACSVCELVMGINIPTMHKCRGVQPEEEP